MTTEPLPGFGNRGEPKRKPREWGIEVAPLGSPGADDMAVRVTLVDRDTGKRVGSRRIPWAEFRDCAAGVFLTNIAEGVHE